MSWKKDYAARVMYTSLPDMGPFRITKAPEPLGKGKYLCRCVSIHGARFELLTFEGTIGSIIQAEGDDDFVIAEFDESSKYVNFRPYRKSEE